MGRQKFITSKMKNHYQPTSQSIRYKKTLRLGGFCFIR
jgi:hypothetical protein